MKQYRSCVMAEEEPVAAYQKLCAEQEAETALRKKQGFLEKDEEHFLEKLGKKLCGACPQAEDVVGKTPEEVPASRSDKS